MTDLPAAPLRHALRRLAHGQTLTRDEAEQAFGVLMRGMASPAQVGALLLGMRARGETADEVAGAALALRREMRQVTSPRRDQLVDTCGTGGGTVTTLNLSTAAAFVVAGAGVPVAKHGNRSYTSRSGSADVLEALGVGIALEAERAAVVLEAAGIVFLFAPQFHPAMRFVAPARGELGVPTVMNLLGPLVNPAGVRRQVVGVADADRGPLMAAALALLGTDHAVVVHAQVGMDEVSPAGPTAVWEVAGGEVKQWTLHPEDHGLADDDLAALAGGTPEENAGRIEAVLEGRGAAAERNAVTLNAAAALYVAGVQPFARAVERAKEAMRAGKGAEALAALRREAPSTSG